MKTLRQILALILILVSISLLVWAILPNRHQVVKHYVEPTAMQVASTGLAEVPTVLEVRQVRLEWLSSMRIGDQAEISLAFEPVQGEILAPTPQGKFSDVYERYYLMAESRLEAAGLQVNPAKPVRESLPAGQTVRFRWQVHGESPGIYQGNVWLSLRFLPLDESPASETLIFVGEVDMHATSLLGMGGPQARMLGGVGIIVGLALSYDVIIDLIKWWRGKKTQRSQRIRAKNARTGTKGFNY